MNDVLARLLLLPTTPQVLVCVLLAGSICTKRKAYFIQASILLAFAMILSTFLKSLFQLPFGNPFNWHYPSGHCFVATCIWSYLLFCYERITWLVWLLIALLGSTVGMAYFNYHHPLEVIAAMPFGLGLALLVNTYRERSGLRDKDFSHRFAWIAVGCGSVLFLYLRQYAYWPYHVFALGFLLIMAIFLSGRRFFRR